MRIIILTLGWVALLISEGILINDFRNGLFDLSETIVVSLLLFMAGLAATTILLG